jgi:hypothetical protein
MLVLVRPYSNIFWEEVFQHANHDHFLINYSDSKAPIVCHYTSISAKNNLNRSEWNPSCIDIDNNVNNVIKLLYLPSLYKPILWIIKLRFYLFDHSSTLPHCQPIFLDKQNVATNVVVVFDSTESLVPITKFSWTKLKNIFDIYIR